MPSSQVPPHGKGSMYIRPLLLGTGGTLGLAPAPEFTFVIYSAAVGSYFASGTLKPIKLKVAEKHRAAPRGVGAAKCAGAFLKRSITCLRYCSLCFELCLPSLDCFLLECLNCFLPVSQLPK